MTTTNARARNEKIRSLHLIIAGIVAMCALRTTDAAQTTTTIKSAHRERSLQRSSSSSSSSSSSPSSSLSSSNSISQQDPDVFLIDGFPRSEENLRGWRNVIGDWANVLGVIFLDCPSDVMQSRILSRAKVEGRNDDNISTMRKRMLTYQEDTMPVIDYYRNENKLHTISASGDKETVYQHVETCIKDLLKTVTSSASSSEKSQD